MTTGVVRITDISKKQYKQIEDRLYRYVDIDETIKELECEIEDRKASQTNSIVEFGVTGGQLITSVQERFYTRPDIMKMMEKIQFLKCERCKVKQFIDSLTQKEKQTYEMCFVYMLPSYNVRSVMGIDRTTLFRRKRRLMLKMQQNLT